MITGVKGFNNKLQCTPEGKVFQYEIGKEYEEPEANACETGFHFCENPLDCFSYYPPGKSRYCEVEGDGKIDKRNDDSKVACSKIKIGAEIGLKSIIEGGIEFIFDRTTFSEENSTTGYRSGAQATGHNSGAQATGDRSGAQATGYRSGAQATGNWSGAQATGDSSGAQATGDRSGAQATGYRSGAQATGDCSGAQATGDWSGAQATGDWSGAQATGDWSGAQATGDCSGAQATGNWSMATTNGLESASHVDGKDAVAMAIGHKSKAKGTKGSWLVLAEWEQASEGWFIKDMKAIKVDDEQIKADTWYVLKDGEFVEV